MVYTAEEEEEEMGNDLMLANLPETFKWGRMGKAEVNMYVSFGLSPAIKKKRKLEDGGWRTEEYYSNCNSDSKSKCSVLIR